MQEIDRIAEANQHLERRARQRAAAAAAQLEANSPEALAAEEERQRKYGPGGLLTSQDEATLLKDTPGEALPELVELLEEADIFEEGNHTPESLQEKLDGALQPVLEGASNDPAILGLGRLAFQWMLVENDEEPGHQLAIQIQVDDQPPAGFVADITPEMLKSWARGKGLQQNRVEHKHFAAGLFDRAIGVAATETANHLIYLLEQLMLGEPTRTSVGPDYDSYDEDVTAQNGDEPDPELSE